MFISDVGFSFFTDRYIFGPSVDSLKKIENIFIRDEMLYFVDSYKQREEVEADSLKCVSRGLRSLVFLCGFGCTCLR